MNPTILTMRVIHRVAIARPKPLAHAARALLIVPTPLALPLLFMVLPLLSTLFTLLATIREVTILD